MNLCPHCKALLLGDGTCARCQMFQPHVSSHKKSTNLYCDHHGSFDRAVYFSGEYGGGVCPECGVLLSSVPRIRVVATPQTQSTEPISPGLQAFLVGVI